MAFGDPASGQRFIVGVQTPWNQNTLGFGLTPEETLARKRRQMAAALGISLSDEEASSLPENVIQQLGMRQIQSRQQEADDARAQQMMESRYRILENQRQQQDQAETMRWRQYLDSEDPMHQHATPAEKDQIAADPKLRQDYLTQRQQQRQFAHVEAQQALKIEIAKKQAETVAQGLKLSAPPEYHDMIDELVQQGQPEKAIIARVHERQQVDRKAAEQERKIKEETEYMVSQGIPEVDARSAAEAGQTHERLARAHEVATKKAEAAYAAHKEARDNARKDLASVETELRGIRTRHLAELKEARGTMEDEQIQALIEDQKREVESLKTERDRLRGLANQPYEGTEKPTDDKSASNHDKLAQQFAEALRRKIASRLRNPAAFPEAGNRK